MKIKSLHKITPGVPLKVCAYARISKDKEELESSLNEQVSYYTSVILENPEWEFSGIYADRGISGTSIYERKQFTKMIENARNGLIDIILVKSISRFARNLLDLLEVVKELRSLGIEIFFEQQNISSLDTKCDQMITLYADFAEEEAKSMSLNVRWRQEKNRRDGVYHIPTGSMKGYRYNKDGEVEIIEEDAKFIRIAFDMYLANYSVQQIVDYFKKNGFKSPTGKEEWNTGSIRNMLQNEKYVGDCLLAKEYVENYKDHKRHLNYGEKDQILITNGHPAIVERDKWNKVQEIFKNRREQFKVKSHKDGYAPSWKPTIYAGYLYCPYCKQNYLIRQHRYKGICDSTFLTCRSNQNTKRCQNGNVQTEILDKAIIKQLSLLRDNLMPLKSALIQGFTDPEAINQKSEIEATQGQITALRAKLEKLNNMHDDYAVALKNEISDEIVELTKIKTKLQTNLLISDSAEDRASQIISTLRKLPSKIDSIADINFKEIISRVIVKNKDTLWFVIGDENAEKVNLRSKLLFKSSIKYLVRKTECELTFGIVINR